MHVDYFNEVMQLWNQVILINAPKTRQMEAGPSETDDCQQQRISKTQTHDEETKMA